jgi:AcrR family transcriptional regulator
VRPLRRDAELNRRKIIESAGIVFGERGLEATLDDIADHAGLGVGTVYRRFPSKEHLVEAMFVERMDDVRALVEKSLAAPDPWQGFVDFCTSIAEMHTSDRGLREIMLSNNFGRARVAESKERLVPLCDELVARAKASGQLRRDFSPTDLLPIQLMVGSVAEYSHDVRPDLWRRYLTLLLDSLRAEPGPPSDLQVPPLDPDSLDDVMCNWHPGR